MLELKDLLGEWKGVPEALVGLEDPSLGGELDSLRLSSVRVLETRPSLRPFTTATLQTPKADIFLLLLLPKLANPTPPPSPTPPPPPPAVLPSSTSKPSTAPRSLPSGPPSPAPKNSYLSSPAATSSPKPPPSSNSTLRRTRSKGP